DRDGTALDPAELAQPLHESGGPWGPGGRRGGAEKSDGRQPLLGAGGEWPRNGRCRRATDHRDEVAPLHSITSSASASSLSGTVRPSALAVLRLSTSSNLVGCSTGRSAGLVPLRIRPT